MNATKETRPPGTSAGNVRQPRNENGVAPGIPGNVSVLGHGTEMHSAELAARAHRHRTSAEIESDLQAACRVIGALAGEARLNARPIDRTALKNVCEGVRRLLIEPVESWREHGQ